MFLKSWSALRREHRELVFRVRQGGDDRMLGEMEGAEAQPIPAVGLRSRGLEHREERRKAKYSPLGYSVTANMRRHTGIAKALWPNSQRNSRYGPNWVRYFDGIMGLRSGSGGAGC